MCLAGSNISSCKDGEVILSWYDNQTHYVKYTCFFQLVSSISVPQVIVLSQTLIEKLETILTPTKLGI